ncbi:MAG: type 4a pilus biogenesis protein PilO [Candidatus Omnitrophota bacterium]
MKFRLNVLYNLNSREKFIIAGAVLVIAGYLLYSFIMPPALYSYQLAAKQFFVQEKLIDSRKKKTEQLLTVKDAFSELQKEMSERKDRFFTDDEAIDFLDNLHKLAEETGNNLEKIKPRLVKIICVSEEDSELFYKDHIVEISLKGKYNSFLDIFKHFAEYDKLLGVNGLNVTPTKDDSLILNAVFYLNIYILDKK